MNRIALLCPTRERPEQVKRLIESLIRTTDSFENVTLYLGIDEDDPTFNQVSEMCCYGWTKVIKISNNGTFIGLGKIWNIMVSQISDDIFTMIGDDMTFETKDWHKEILKEFENSSDKVLLVHTNSGIRPAEQAFADNSFIHRIYYDTFGYYVREDWKHWFHDTWLHDVFTKLNRRVYRHDILIYHHHPDNPNIKVQPDKITQRLNDSKQDWWDPNDPFRTFRAKEDIRIAEVKKLQEIIGKIQKGTNPIKLSILICTLSDRYVFLERLLTCLNKQKTEEVEILVNCDNREKTIGKKRNELIERSSGDYISFIDDDDLVSDTYISLVLNAIKTNPDVLGLHLLMTQNGSHEERTYHSLKYTHWWDEPDPDRPGKRRYFRNPNHLNPVKRGHAVKVKFPELNHGEDHDYSKNLFQYLKTEEYIEEPIYFYLYRSNK